MLLLLTLSDFIMEVTCILYGSDFDALAPFGEYTKLQGAGKRRLIYAFNDRADFDSMWSTSRLSKVIEVDGSFVSVKVHEAAGGQDYDQLRPLIHSIGDIFFLIYSIADPTSFAQIKGKFYPEISELSKSCVLLGMGTESRDTRQRFVTLEEGKELAQQLGVPNFECSASSKEEIAVLFEMAVRIVQQRRKRQNRRKWQFLHKTSCCMC